jgi:hypothetical protein
MYLAMKNATQGYNALRLIKTQEFEEVMGDIIKVQTCFEVQSRNHTKVLPLYSMDIYP